MCFLQTGERRFKGFDVLVKLHLDLNTRLMQEGPLARKLHGPFKYIHLTAILLLTQLGWWFCGGLEIKMKLLFYYYYY